MSSLGSPSPFLIAGKKSYTVGRSLRFNRSDNAYLSRTPSSAGNRKTWTYSAWVKLGQTGINTSTDPGNGLFLSCGAGSNAANMALRITNNGYIGIDYYGVGGYYSTGRLRDPSAWYHCVWVMDTTESTAANRMKVYVNGTLFYNNQMSLSQNADTPINNNSATTIGVYPYNTSHAYRLDGYLAEVNFIDGQALTPSSFAETDTTTGQWVPKDTSGLTFGTNGFYLKFADNSGTTATTLGKDSSGNGNNFTPNNFSVSAGESNDSLEDTPTNNFPTISPIDGGTNGLLSNGNTRFKPNSSNGGNFNAFYSTFSMRSGKWYFEVLIGNTNSGTNSIQFGIGSYKYKRDSSNQNGYPGTSGLTFLNVNNSSSSYRIGVVDGSSVGSSVSTASTDDVYGIAFDADNKKVYFYKNGSAEGESSGYNVTDVGTGDFFFFSTLRYSSGGSYTSGDPTLAINFGQRAFSHTPPTGYKKLNSQNLPNPTILKPNQHFDTLLWTANASTQTISGLNFSPDWVWGKSRDDSYDHELYDTLRGVLIRLKSNSSGSELTHSGNLQSFNSDGYTLGSQTNMNYNSGSDIVGWNWNAGNTDSKTYTVTVVNDGGNKYRFDGYGTSAVTLSLAKGGTYTFNYPSAHPLRFSTTSDGTHGGGSEYTSGVSTYGSSITITVASNAPTLYYYCSQHSGMGGQVNTTTTLGSSNFGGAIQSIVKANTTSGFSIVTYTGNGGTGTTVGHGLGVAPDLIIIKSRSTSDGWAVYHSSLGATKYLNIDGADTVTTSSSTWANTSPTSSAFTVNSNPRVNSSTGHVAYCFSEVAGYSKFGTYEGNGSSDGTFVYTGFKPAFILTKSTTSTHWWEMADNTRVEFNPRDKTLYSNRSDTEYSGSNYHKDFLSNGFKARSDNGGHNGSGNTYIYLAFAESPFKNTRAG